MPEGAGGAGVGGAEEDLQPPHIELQPPYIELQPPYIELQPPYIDHLNRDGDCGHLSL